MAPSEGIETNPHLYLGETILRQTVARREIQGGVKSSPEDLQAIARSSLYEILEDDYSDKRELLTQYGLGHVKSSSNIEIIGHQRWHIYASARGATIEVDSPRGGYDTFTIIGTDECREGVTSDLQDLARSQGYTLREEQCREARYLQPVQQNDG